MVFIFGWTTKILSISSKCKMVFWIFYTRASSRKYKPCVKGPRIFSQQVEITQSLNTKVAVYSAAASVALVVLIHDVFLLEYGSCSISRLAFRFYPYNFANLLTTFAAVAGCLIILYIISVSRLFILKSIGCEPDWDLNTDKENHCPKERCPSFTRRKSITQGRRDKCHDQDNGHSN